jgi:SynChlorMet cassette protein ScmC
MNNLSEEGRPQPWKPLCDDETLVVLDRQKQYRAHPFPTWSDYLWERAENTWNVQYSVPVAAVFFLERAESDEVSSLGEGQAAVLMNESATQVCEKFWRRMDAEFQRQFRMALFDNACRMAMSVPAFRLRASLHCRFWEEMEKVIG